jgi:hypothetical protein
LESRSGTAGDAGPPLAHARGTSTARVILAQIQGLNHLRQRRGPYGSETGRCRMAGPSDSGFPGEDQLSLILSRHCNLRRGWESSPRHLAVNLVFRQAPSATRPPRSGGRTKRPRRTKVENIRLHIEQLRAATFDRGLPQESPVPGKIPATVTRELREQSRRWQTVASRGRAVCHFRNQNPLCATPGSQLWRFRQEAARPLLSSRPWSCLGGPHR